MSQLQEEAWIIFWTILVNSLSENNLPVLWCHFCGIKCEQLKIPRLLKSQLWFQWLICPCFRDTKLSQPPSNLWWGYAKRPVLVNWLIRQINRQCQHNPHEEHSLNGVGHLWPENFLLGTQEIHKEDPEMIHLSGSGFKQSFHGLGFWTVVTCSSMHSAFSATRAEALNACQISTCFHISHSPSVVCPVQPLGQK